MNRPRNRAPRQNGNNQRHALRGSPRTGNGSVPTIQQVVPGSSVSIVLKADQATGKEVQGIVKDPLTRGDHPRGIKVRLQDGRIGRVQRMTTGVLPNAATAESISGLQTGGVSTTSRDGNEEPPSRTLADFLPSSDNGGPDTDPPESAVSFTSPMIKCPMCGLFEGDEAAVSHHIQEHLD
ncbi:hypothetical protein LTR37_002034 [Vermiconidia calcicola]|uniref:Uncharacterized protein n=1 Tax=Vermiconidia calcicola TaxID=1690605 RepID=A0ACC3NTG3_9PEZI|nr:hypothetical protein LTR37_002034 [Vermiconidia calcicola]